MTEQNNEAPPKDKNCKTESCNKGGCGMKLNSPCCIVKIIMLVVAIGFIVNYLIK